MNLCSISMIAVVIAMIVITIASVLYVFALLDEKIYEQEDRIRKGE